MHFLPFLYHRLPRMLLHNQTRPSINTLSIGKLGLSLSTKRLCILDEFVSIIIVNRNSSLLILVSGWPVSVTSTTESETCVLVEQPISSLIPYSSPLATREFGAAFLFRIVLAFRGFSAVTVGPRIKDLEGYAFLARILHLSSKACDFSRRLIFLVSSGCKASLVTLGSSSMSLFFLAIHSSMFSITLLVETSSRSWSS
jgi:hypothetical protein